MFELLNAIVPHSRAIQIYVTQLLVSADGKPGGGPLLAAKDAAFVEPLSQRESAVLRLLGSELTGPDIARELVVSLSTVRTHTRSIYAKLGVTSRRAAVRRADELNLLP